MARHSAAEQAMEAIAIASPRIEPPVELSPEEAQYWRAIVESMPPHWFGGSNQHLLCELVHHLTLSKQVNEAIATMRKTPLTAATTRGAKERAAFQELLDMAGQEARIIASLSAKLKLSNSAHRLDQRYDDRRKVVTPQGPKPWERQRQ
jgi:hypothetical protein